MSNFWARVEDVYPDKLERKHYLVANINGGVTPLFWYPEWGEFCDYNDITVPFTNYFDFYMIAEIPPWDEDDEFLRERENE
jgi:hypothetical protein